MSKKRKDKREFSDKGLSLEDSPMLEEKDKGNGKWKPCAATHPGLDLGEGRVIYGGKAYDPVVTDADIYVSLDRGKDIEKRAYPWNGAVQFVLFPITDMSAPSDVDEFKKMITWLAAQIVAGKKVHVGCVGGHGRTGTVFAALVKEMTGNADAIQYVREHYCDKAVESWAQVEFLMKHYGVTKVKGTKTYDSYLSGGSKKSFEDRYPDWITDGFTPRGHGGSSKKFNDLYAGKKALSDAPKLDKGGDVAVVDPVQLHGNVWGLTQD